MNTSSIYEAAYYLSSKYNELADIEVIGESVYYHIDGDNIVAMKKKYHRANNANVNYHAFTSALLRLQDITRKALAGVKQTGVAPERSVQ
jgi:hypothetical protein